ncbi:hypothetical protein YTPLAS18_13030 [Nitrospira sp.]|nr:hypothetical protein YTPLAS18_13030 [Nitrospira sp.]
MPNGNVVVAWEGRSVILLLADATDPWSTHVERELIRRHQPVSRVDPRSLCGGLSFDWRLEGSSRSSFHSITPDHVPVEARAELRAVLVRMQIGALELPEDTFNSEDQVYAQMEWSAALFGWLNALSCPVINPPVPGRSGRLFPMQASVQGALLQLGVAVPPHAVASTRETVLEHYAQWNELARAQSLGPDAKVHYLQGGDGHAVVDAMLAHGPILLQAVPEGSPVRAVVVGEEVIGGTRRTAAQDGCLRESIWDAAPLPPSLANVCRRLAGVLALPFVDIEMVQGHEGQLSCLGISESPAYGQYSDRLRHLIVDRLVNLLDNTEERRAHDPYVWPTPRSDHRQPGGAACCPIS